MVNTKKVTERRSLSFSSLLDIVAEVDRLDASPRRATGNWSPAQIVEHVGRTIRCSIDGFPPEARPPAPLRVLGRLLKGSAMKRINPGIKLPASVSVLVPAPEVQWSSAVATLRDACSRGERDGMSEPSPVFGPMSTEDWTRLHCRHAEMHFSFIHPA